MQQSSFEIELLAWQFCSTSQMLKFWLPTSTNCFCHLVLPIPLLFYQYHLLGLGAELITEERRPSLLKLWHDSTKLLFQPVFFRIHGMDEFFCDDMMNPNRATNFAFLSVNHSLRRGFWCCTGDGVVAIRATNIYVCVTISTRVCINYIIGVYHNYNSK